MRRFLQILLILNGLFLPLSCFPLIFLFNAVNPMQLAFITDFTVENRTAKTIFVTPIGTVGPQGDRHSLPLTRWKAPWYPASQHADIPISAGEKVTLFYDSDDINFSELVVATEDGTVRQLVVNPAPTARQYVIPDVTDFVIDDVNRLDAVGPTVQAACHEARQPRKSGLFDLAVLAIPAITFVALLKFFQRTKPRPPEGWLDESAFLSGEQNLGDQ
jgi:hypothetical protein